MEENENRDERRGGEKVGKLDKLPPMFGHFCCRLAVQPYCRSVPLFSPLCEADSGYFWSGRSQFCQVAWQLGRLVGSGRRNAG